MDHHKHCLFCGEVISANPSDPAICYSPNNPLPVDTVGNKHHGFMQSIQERAKIAADRAKGRESEITFFSA